MRIQYHSKRAIFHNNDPVIFQKQMKNFLAFFFLLLLSISYSVSLPPNDSSGFFCKYPLFRILISSCSEFIFSFGHYDWISKIEVQTREILNSFSCSNSTSWFRVIERRNPSTLSFQTDFSLVHVCFEKSWHFSISTLDFTPNLFFWRFSSP